MISLTSLVISKIVYRSVSWAKIQSVSVYNFNNLIFWHDSMDMHIIVVAKLDKKIMRLTGEYRPTTFTQT